MGYFMQLFIWGSVVSSTGYLLLHFTDSLDLFKVIHNHTPGPCQFVRGVEFGAEDVAALPSGIALLSTGLQFTNQLSNRQIKPALKWLDLSTKGEPVAKDLAIIGFKGTLNPHGISLFQKEEKIYAYVINHPPFNEHPPADTVEKFLWQVDEERLVHEKSFSDPTFLGLNDLVVVEEDKFYISNYQVIQNQAFRVLENPLIPLPLENVVYFDGGKGVVVLDGRYGPNGINTSPDKKFVYLSEVNKRRISSFRIEESPSNLTMVSQRYLGSFPDNINVDPQTGDLWIGAHAVGHQLIRAVLFGDQNSPSQVLKVGVQDGQFTRSNEIFLDDGSTLSFSSAAVYGKGSVLIGTVENKALLCKCLSC